MTLDEFDIKLNALVKQAMLEAEQPNMIFVYDMCGRLRLVYNRIENRILMGLEKNDRDEGRRLLEEKSTKER